MYPSIKPLPFKPKMLQGLSEKLIVSHYVNNYGGAARRLAVITDEGHNQWPKIGYQVNGLKKEELIAANSVFLHEIYFASLGGNGDLDKLDAGLRQAIEENFGSFEQWWGNFSDMGKALAGGSGWVLLVWSPRWRKMMNITASDHTQNLAGADILLALDMFEHAYHMDFGADAGKYIDCFKANINWGSVSDRFTRLISEEQMGDKENISPSELAMKGAEPSKFVVLDVRMKEDFDIATDMIEGAKYFDPDEVELWARNIPADQSIIVYCAYGFGVGKGVAKALRDKGFNANALEGGIAAWHAMGGPVDAKKN